MRATVTADGAFTFGRRTFRAAIGRGGITADKREGDGATPADLLRLRKLLYRPDRGPAPRCEVPVETIAPNDGWCDDPAHPAYNHRVRLPIDGSAEALWRDDAIYDIIGILSWNDDPVRPMLGSAIFLHVARKDFAPTDGCVALAADDLRHVLATGLTEIMIVNA